MIKNIIIKFNVWFDKHGALSFAGAMAIIIGVMLIGEQFHVNHILLPIVAGILVTIRISYAIIRYQICNKESQKTEEDDCVDDYYNQNEYWWEIVSTIIDADSKSYDDSLKIIRRLKNKYTITPKK